MGFRSKGQIKKNSTVTKKMVETTANIAKTFNATGKFHLERSIEIMEKVTESIDRPPQPPAKNVPDKYGTNKATRLKLWTQPASPKIETGIFYREESRQTLGGEPALDLADWQLVFLPGHSVSDRHAEIYDKAYALWSSVWSKTFDDLDGNETLYSDDFSRRDEIVVLCHRDEPVALSLFHRLDLRRAAHRSDSYFKPFPESLLDTIIAEGQHDVLIGSYFTLASNFRKGMTEVPVKEILFGAVVQRFVASGSSLMLGIMRKDRGMHALGERFGARPILADICYHSVAVDLVKFTSTSAYQALNASQHHDSVTELWARRIDSTINTEPSPNRWLKNHLHQDQHIT